MNRIVTGPKVVDWVAKRLRATFSAQAVGIGVSRGELIAGVVYDDFNSASMCMHVAAEVGTPWLTRGTLWRFFHYPFNELGLNVVIATVAEGNERSQRLVEGVGFRLHTKIPDAHPTGNMHIYIMRREWCKWIGNHELKAA
jgi:hypothetical protein